MTSSKPKTVRVLIADNISERGIDRLRQTAGFEVIGSDPEFTTTGRGTRQWMLVAQRPAQLDSGS